MESNIRLICPDCLQTRTEEIQDGIKDKLTEAMLSTKRLYVKFEFKDEHVWLAVRILNLSEGRVYGKLANNLVTDQRYKVGYPIGISISMIEEILLEGRQMPNSSDAAIHQGRTLDLGIKSREYNASHGTKVHDDASLKKLLDNEAEIKRLVK